MTGEISLRGWCFPWAGSKKKCSRQRRAGITSVLLPELNRKDLEEIPPPAGRAFAFEFLKTADDALRLALEPDAPGGYSPGETLAARPLS
jgi:ATP-dependent Lon protease